VSDFLDQMASASRQRARAAQHLPRAEVPVRPLCLDGFDLIAEIKLSAPSSGVLASPSDPLVATVTQALAYESGGAAAVSVLTEPSRFGGSLEHLRAVAEAVQLPVMRKDFLVDPVQVDEARAAGASGVLLILGILDDPTLEACLQAASGHGMFVLLEAFDGAEIERAVSFLGPNVLLGINCRDLRTLAVVPDRLRTLVSKCPAGVIRVAESGVMGPADAARLASLGFQLALVGTALMRSTDPEDAVMQMVSAGRQGGEACASA